MKNQPNSKTTLKKITFAVTVTIDNYKRIKDKKCKNRGTQFMIASSLSNSQNDD